MSVQMSKTIQPLHSKPPTLPNQQTGSFLRRRNSQQKPWKTTEECMNYFHA